MKTQAAECSSAVKKLLKEKYPTISFSVWSKNYSGGNSVHVEWNLGPTGKEVDALINKFQYGHFDGMTDFYECSNDRKDIPQAKYVCATRHYKTEEELAAEKHNINLRWSDPARIDLWKEEKTLHHIIARDICKLVGIEYTGLQNVLPKEYQHMVTGHGDHGTFSDLIYQLISVTPLMTGYHGIKKAIGESGVEIQNTFVIY